MRDDHVVIVECGEMSRTVILYDMRCGECLIFKILLIRKKRPKLDTQSNSIFARNFLCEQSGAIISSIIHILVIHKHANTHFFYLYKVTVMLLSPYTIFCMCYSSCRLIRFNRRNQTTKIRFHWIVNYFLRMSPHWRLVPAGNNISKSFYHGSQLLFKS